jgi:hypothetical protein
MDGTLECCKLVKMSLDRGGAEEEEHSGKRSSRGSLWLHSFIVTLHRLAPPKLLPLDSGSFRLYCISVGSTFGKFVSMHN